MSESTPKDLHVKGIAGLRLPEQGTAKSSNDKESCDKLGSKTTLDNVTGIGSSGTNTRRNAPVDQISNASTLTVQINDT